MSFALKSQALLEIHLYGPGVEQWKIYLSDLVLLGQKLQSALNHVAYGLRTNNSSRQRRRLPNFIKAQCELQLVALMPGSVVLALDLPTRETDFDHSDLGMKALETLISGMGALCNQQVEFPEGYDQDVLQDWEEIGKIFGRGHGVDRIQFNLRSTRGPLQYNLNPETFAQIPRRIPGAGEFQKVEGHLWMANFEESKRRCGIYPSVGSSISCTFDKATEGQIKNLLTKYVRAIGKARQDRETGRITSLRIKEIHEVETPMVDSERSWHEATLEELTLEQSVRPIQRLEEVLGRGEGLWKDAEEFEGFVHGIYQQRKEARQRGE